MKIRILHVIYLLLFVSSHLSGQQVGGKVMGPGGIPLDGANIFIRQTMQGVSTNERGEFQLYLSPGDYIFEVSSLGYEKQLLPVKVGSRTETLSVYLKPTVYMLPEVRVTTGGEDPAYAIMRRAIARAPYHRNQVECYTAEVYTRGRGKVEKIPGVLKVAMSAEDRKEMESHLGKIMVLESFSEVSFRAPETYESKVKAFSSTFPDELDPRNALGIIKSSIYDPEIVGMLSPLSAGAFANYRFRFVESYLQDGKVVNKIRVEAKKNNMQLMWGELHIEEEDWSVVNFDLTAKIMGAEARVRTMFHEVTPGIYLPTSYNIDATFKLMGVAASGKYNSSIKYSNLEVNRDMIPVVSTPVDQPSPSLKPAQQKALHQLEALSKKEELTTREAYRMAKLSREVFDEVRRPDTLHPLEVLPYNANVRVEADSMAVRRDSVFWEQVRTVPLSAEERLGYKERDSILQMKKTISRDTLGSSFRRRTSLWNTALEGGYLFRNKQSDFKIDGLLKSVPEYNFVDGVWIGQELTWYTGKRKYQSFKVTAGVYYVTARKHLNWSGEFEWRYAPERNGRLKVKGGDLSLDFKQDLSSWRFGNSLTSLVVGNNYMKFYRARHLSVSNFVEIGNGLWLTLGAQFQYRNPLENKITYNFRNAAPDPNIPEGMTVEFMPVHQAASWDAGITYTPRYYYRMRGRWKHYVKSNWPTFRITYKHGFSVGNKPGSRFHQAEGEIWQRFGIGLFDSFSYLLAAGKFWDAEKLYFPDYKHFGSSGWAYSRDGFMADYFMGDYYRLSTREYWFRGALNYHSMYLLFKNLPFLQRALIDEAVHLRFLWTPERKNYLETGYSAGLGELRIGVFLHWERMKYQGIGLRFHIPLNVW